MKRRIVLALTLVLAALVPSTAAHAAAQDKSAILSQWTQPTAASTAAWNAARLNPAPWAAYNFDWSTDLCSSSPDNPLGFAFANSCWRHDFGYRNYKDIGQFPPNKARLDNAFYADLRQVCTTYNALVRPACYSLAWTYYQAVSIFGTLDRVTQADLDRAEKLLYRNE